MERNGLDADTEKLVSGRPTDKNGKKMLRAAFKQNIPVQQSCDSVASKYNVSNSFKIFYSHSIHSKNFFHNCYNFPTVL